MKSVISKALVLSTLLAACNFDSFELDKVQGPSLAPNIAINLGSISYTAGDLVESLEDETIEIIEEDDLFLKFLKRDTSYYDNIGEFITLNKDISNEDSYSPFDSDIPAQGTENTVVIPSKTFDFEFNPDGGEQIDSTFFKGGTLEYTFSSDFNVQVDYVLTLTDIQNSSSEPVVFTNTLQEGESSKTESTPLDGLKNVAKRVGDSNIFNASLDLVFTIPAGTAINSSEEVALELVFRNSEFSVVFGDFGTDPVDIKKDSIEITLFEEFNDGGLFLNNPSIEFELNNAFGVEFGVSLDGVNAISDGGSKVNLEGSVVDNLQFVDASKSDDLGTLVSSSFSINTENSNIDELFNSSPDDMVFTVGAIPNSTGSDNPNNYLLDRSYLEIITTIEIPIDLELDGFSKDYDLSIDGSELADADSIVLNTRVLNDIPFNGQLDLSFRDKNGEEIYFLSDIGIIESPAVGADGRTNEKSETISSIVLSEEGIEAFLQTTDIVATINIYTFESDADRFVKLFSDYQLEIYLTAQGKVTVDL